MLSVAGYPYFSLNYWIKNIFPILHEKMFNSYDYILFEFMLHGYSNTLNENNIKITTYVIIICAIIYFIYIYYKKMIILLDLLRGRFECIEKIIEKKEED